MDDSLSGERQRIAQLSSIMPGPGNMMQIHPDRQDEAEAGQGGEVVFGEQGPLDARLGLCKILYRFAFMSFPPHPDKLPVMTISQMLLPEFDHEMASTRKILACVPEDKLTWQPHEKSMTMGRLASHIAELPHWAVETIARETLESPGQKPFLAASKDELMAALRSIRPRLARRLRELPMSISRLNGP